MRKSILAVAAALSLAGAAGGAVTAMAQPAQPPGPPPGAQEMDRPVPPPGGPMGGMHERMEWMQRHARAEMERRRPFEPGTFALFAPNDNRQLTPADVQTIAEALLLWHGNHTWKVTNVTPGPDNSVQFTYAAPDGTVIAQFAMDTRTGRISRIG